MHARWRHFVASWRALAPGAPLHFCSSDITQCYDTIDQSRLLETVRAALRAHGASVQRRYSVLAPPLPYPYPYPYPCPYPYPYPYPYP